MTPKSGLSRRKFVKGTGGLLIGFSLADFTVIPQLLDGAPAETAATPAPGNLDAWLRVEKDGSIQVFSGKMEVGLGVGTAYTQIVAEELDVAPSRVSFVLGDTSNTPDQGGVGGSTSIALGSKPLRNVAATTRYLLMQLAGRRLGVDPLKLQVRDGIISVKDDPAKRVSYGDLAGGTDLNDALKVSGDGFALNVEGQGKPKDPASYTVVGKSLPRIDLPQKITGHFQYVTDVRVPGMLHGRVVRPAGVGAKLESVDDTQAKKIAGYVRTVTNGNFVGLVAQTEWAAVQAAAALKVNWSAPETPFPNQQDLYRYMRTAAPKLSHETLRKGDAEKVLASASRKVMATYEWPFQSHATMGPGCSVADVRRDGVTTIWSGTQKPHALKRTFAEMLRVPADQVRVIWVEDAGSYGRPGYEDVATDAVLLSQAMEKPVRVQWTRSDMTAWGSKGPAVLCDLAAALDGGGEVTGFHFASRAFSGGNIMWVPNGPGNCLGNQLTGVPNTTGTDELAQWGAQTIAYEFPNVLAESHVLPPLFPLASPLRTSHLRDPNGPATAFAAESFVDEIAAAAGVDPLDWRLRHIQDDRAKAVLTAAAEKFGWDRRPSPKKADAKDVATGRGIAVINRGGTRVATVAEVEVNRRTGMVRVKRFVCAHDCGLIVNPESLRGAIEGNLVHSLSRALKEEVTFSASRVTSVDWQSYPVARASDIPPKVDVVLLNHPEQPSSGAGEPSSRPTAAAIANAIFDATGARVRQAPMTPARVKAALGKIKLA